MKKLLLLLLLFAYQYTFGLNKGISQAEGFAVANVLQSNMVIQQGKNQKIWGTAKPGSQIEVSTDWLGKPVYIRSAASGNWMVEIKVPTVKKGDYKSHTITVHCGSAVTNLNNVLIGEVWLCSGQSNMEMTMKPALPWHKGVIDNEREIAGANYPNIRLFRIPRDTSMTLQPEAKGQWQPCSPQSVADFSGVAYYFARHLQSKIDLPVGLVLAAYGGAACQAFTSRKALSADNELKAKYLDPYDANPNGKDLVARPTLIYNRMIYPLLQLSIKGILWYQGESNSKDQLYDKLCSAMLDDWRHDFHQGKLPFYFVQMTPYNWKSNNAKEDYYARFREIQASMLKQKSTGMAVTMDVGEPDVIHPRRKKEVGIRLALIALKKTYGNDSTVYLGPLYNKVTIEGNTAIIHYNKASIGSGLTTADGLAPKHFYLAESDGVFTEANAKISDNTIVLQAVGVQKPVWVRYAFLNAVETNLMNKEGLPAFPFRTDHLKEVHYR